MSCLFPDSFVSRVNMTAQWDALDERVTDALTKNKKFDAVKVESLIKVDVIEWPEDDIPAYRDEGTTRESRMGYCNVIALIAAVAAAALALAVLFYSMPVLCIGGYCISVGYVGAIGAGGIALTALITRCYLHFAQKRLIRKFHEQAMLQVWKLYNANPKDTRAVQEMLDRLKSSSTETRRLSLTLALEDPQIMANKITEWREEKPLELLKIVLDLLRIIPYGTGHRVSAQYEKFMSEVRLATLDKGRESVVKQ